MKKPSIDEMSKSQALVQLVAISTAGICKKKLVSALANLVSRINHMLYLA